MHSEIIFDVRLVGYKSAYFPAIGLIFLTIGVVLLTINFSRKRRGLPAIRNNSGNSAPWFPPLVIAFSLVWCLGTLFTTYSDYRRLRTSIEQGQCRVVEGVVQNFHPGGNYRGETDESFDVSGVHFSYSAYDVCPGFNQTSAKNGPIHGGIRVRIFENLWGHR